LVLDVTDAEQIRAAVEEVDALDVLINNAGISLQAISAIGRARTADRVNFFGAYDVTQAFLLCSPAAQRHRQHSVAGVPCRVPFDSLLLDLEGGTFSLSQSLRACWPARRERPCRAARPIDTDMTRNLDIEASPRSVAQAIFDGVENGRRNLPRPMSAGIADGWPAAP